MLNSSCPTTFTYDGYTYEFRNQQRQYQQARDDCRNTPGMVSFDLIHNFTEGLLDRLRGMCPDNNQTYWIGLTRNNRRCQAENNRFQFMWIRNGTCVNLEEAFPSYDRERVQAGCNRTAVNFEREQLVSRGSGRRCRIKNNANRLPYICQTTTRRVEISKTRLLDVSKAVASTTNQPSTTSFKQLSSSEIAQIGGGVAAAAAFFFIAFFILFLWRRKKQKKAYKLKNMSSFINVNPKKVEKQIEEHIKKVTQRSVKVSI